VSDKHPAEKMPCQFCGLPVRKTKGEGGYGATVTYKGAYGRVSGLTAYHYKCRDAARAEGAS
jgi:hypothetical protein